MHLSFIKSQGHGLIMRVVFYHGVGSQVFMDSFFVTGVDPKAIMSQNEEAIEKLFFIPLSRTSWRTPFYLSLVTNKKVGLRPSCTLPSFYEPLLILNFVREGTGLLTGQPFFMRRFTLKGKWALLLWALGAPMVREKEKGLILCCIWHEMIKRELRLSMNSGLTELLALLCFSLLSYQRVPILLFEISSFVPNRLQNQILFHKILYQLYILLAFMPETSPVLWALAYVDPKWWMGLWHSTRRQCERMPPKRMERCFALLDASDPV